MVENEIVVESERMMEADPVTGTLFPSPPELLTALQYLHYQTANLSDLRLCKGPQVDLY